MTQNQTAEREPTAPGTALVYYITAHGYGHGVRSTDILRAFHARYPATPIHVVSDLPEAFLRHRCAGIPLALRRAACDVGMVQRDAVQADVEATRTVVNALVSDWPALVRREIEFLRAHRVGAVVCDIPGVPIEAARACGLPALAVGNFSWDWIYEAYAERHPDWGRAVALFRRAYGQADLLLRLPFHRGMEAFPRTEDLALTARPGRARRPELAALTGAPVDRPWVLLSFNHLAWDARAVQAVARLREYCFFTMKPMQWEAPNCYAVDREALPHADVLASCELVVSKPGFGIVSECAVNRKPLVYVDREHFAEYDVLVEGVRRTLRHAHVPAARFYEGDLGAALRAAAEAPEPAEQLDGGGDTAAARRLGAIMQEREGRL